MSGVGVSAAWVLAAVLLTAAAGKLRAVEDTWARFGALGLPAPRVLAVAVPLAEVACALLLVVRPRVGGLAAMVLLGVFTLWLASAVRAGTAVGCGCFGSGHTAAPVSYVELVRNGLLGVAAALAVTAPRADVPTLVDVLTVGAGTATAAVAVALAALRRDLGRLWDNTVEAGP